MIRRRERDVQEPFVGLESVCLVVLMYNCVPRSEAPNQMTPFRKLH